MLAGGWKESSGLTEEQYTMVTELRHAVQEKAGKEFAHFNPVAIRSQVVAGTNFFVKIQVSESEYVHVKIFRPLPHTNQGPQVNEVHLEKSQHDEL